MFLIILCMIGIILGPVVVIIEDIRTRRRLQFLAELDKLNNKEK